MRDEFSVAQFFLDGSYEYECRFVSAEEAVKTAHRLTETVGASFGFVQRIIITDGGDFTNFEWQFGKGITYPPREKHHEPERAPRKRSA